MFMIYVVIDREWEYISNCKERTSGRLVKMLESAGKVQSSIMTGSFYWIVSHLTLHFSPQGNIFIKIRPRQSALRPINFVIGFTTTGKIL